MRPQSLQWCFLFVIGWKDAKQSGQCDTAESSSHGVTLCSAALISFFSFWTWEVIISFHSSLALLALSSEKSLNNDDFRCRTCGGCGVWGFSGGSEK